MNQTLCDEWTGKPQKFSLVTLLHACEIAAVKSNLDMISLLFFMTEVFVYCFPEGVFCNSPGKISGGLMHIAENASVRATLIHNEKGDNHMCLYYLLLPFIGDGGSVLRLRELVQGFLSCPLFCFLFTFSRTCSGDLTYDG
jgi:hypothetical protein